MRSFRYRRDHPMGVIFSTDGSDPGEPRLPDGWYALGWREEPVGSFTRDELIEAVVREELAKQPKDKERLEAEYTKKTGEIPHFAAKEKTLVSVLDDNRARERKRQK